MGVYGIELFFKQYFGNFDFNVRYWRLDCKVLRGSLYSGFCCVSTAIFQNSLIQRLPWIIERTEMSTGLIVKCVVFFGVITNHFIYFSFKFLYICINY